MSFYGVQLEFLTVAKVWVGESKDVKIHRSVIEVFR
jgi:hypothetical protein